MMVFVLTVAVAMGITFEFSDYNSHELHIGHVCVETGPPAMRADRQRELATDAYPAFVADTPTLSREPAAAVAVGNVSLIESNVHAPLASGNVRREIVFAAQGAQEDTAMSVGTDAKAGRDVWRPKIKARQGNTRAGVQNEFQKRVRTTAEEESRMMLESEQRLRSRTFHVLLCVYVATLFMAWGFTYHLLSVSVSHIRGTLTTKRFCVIVNGLPESATNSRRVEAYMRDWLPEGKLYQVMGVSIAYDYSNGRDLIDKAFLQLVRDSEKQREPLQWIKPGEATTTDEALAESPRLKESSVHVIDLSILRILDITGGGHLYHGEEVDGVIMRKALRSFRCSGRAYVVLRSQAAVRWAVANGQEAPAFETPGHGGVQLGFQRADSEPEDIRWEHHFRDATWAPRLMIAIVGMLFMILVYFASVVPLATMYIHVAHVPGVSVHWACELLLGVLPGIGGAVLFNALVWATDFVGYYERSSRDDWLVFMGFFLTFLTVFSDLGLTLVLAEGTAWDTSLEAGGIINFDRALARELFYCLVPGYVLCVAVIPSNLETLVPYTLARLLIRGNSVPLRVAENCITPPSLELACKYTDVLTGVSAMLCMLPFMSPRVWKALLCGCVMVGIAFVDTHWKILRCYMTSRCTSERMAWNAMHVFVVPLSILGASVGFWGWESEALSASSACRLPMVGAMLYLIVLRFIKCMAPGRDVEESSHGDYLDTVEKLRDQGYVSTFLNTNPVHCLRARYLDLDEAAGGCLQDSLPFRRGKEHCLIPNLRAAYTPRGFFQEIVALFTEKRRARDDTSAFKEDTDTDGDEEETPSQGGADDTQCVRVTS